jgi:hypothetical protein
MDKVVNPNVVFLRQCGLSDCDITKLCFQIQSVSGRWWHAPKV